MTKSRKIILAAIALALLYAVDALNLYLRYNSIDLDCKNATVHTHKRVLECKKPPES